MVGFIVFKFFLICTTFFFIQKLLRMIPKNEETKEDTKFRRQRISVTASAFCCFFTFLVIFSTHGILCDNDEVLVIGGINKEIKKVINEPGLYFTLPFTPSNTYVLNKDIKVELINSCTCRDEKKIFTKDMKRLYIVDGYITYNIKNLDVLTGLIQIFGFDIQDGLYDRIFNNLKVKAGTFKFKNFSENKLSESVIENFYRSLEKELGIKNIENCLDINIILLTSNKPK